MSLKQLKPEYQRLWDTMEVLPSRLPEATAIARKIELSRSRYQAVANAIGCPWTFIAVIHSLEASLSFSAHLHNGDPLGRRTVREPIGYPKTPPKNGWGAGYEWEESAIDALKLKKTHQAEDWSIAAQLWRLELYNGMGYRLYHPEVLSPYLWSGSNHYRKGKYVADGSFKASAVSAQIGAAVLLKLLSPAPTVPLSVPPTILQPLEEKGGAAVLSITFTPGTYLKQSTEEQSRDLPPADIQWLDKDSELAVRWWRKVAGKTGDYYACTLDGLNFKGKNTWYAFAKHVTLIPKGAIASLPGPEKPVPIVANLASVKSTAIADRLIAYMQSKNYAIFTEEEEVNIVYLEGADADGKPNQDVLNVWNDRRIVILFASDRPTVALNVFATTEPGSYYTENPMNALGAARIQFNQFAAWRMGWHKIGHESLIQAAPVTVHRDFNEDGSRSGDRLDTGIFHINQHHGGDSPLQDIGRWSAGCLVGRSTREHATFISLCKRDPRYRRSSGYLFHTAIIPGDDFHEATYR